MAQEKDNEKGLNRPEDVRDRKRVEETVRGQADLLQKTFDSMTDAIFILEAKAPPAAPTILECNEAASAIFGYDKTEMLGKTTDFLHVSEGALREFQSQLYSVVQQGRFPFQLQEFRMKRKDGSVFPSEHSISQLLNDKGERTGWVSIVRDISERKRMEDELHRYSTQLEGMVFERTKKLAESERRFRETVDLLPQIVFEANERGNVTFVNRIAFSSVGYTQEDMDRGLNVAETLVPEDRVRVRENVARILSGKQLGANEYTVLRKDGTTFPVIIHSSPVIRKGNPVGLRGIIIDITEHKRAEEAYRTVVQHALQGLAILQDNRIVFANQALLEMSGYSLEETLSLAPDDVIARTHPEDRTRIWTEMQKLLAGKPVSPRETLRLIRKDGTIRWVEVLASRIEYQGKPAMQVAYADITERRRMEEELKRHTEHLEELVSERTKELRSARERLDYVVKSNPAVIYSGKPLADHSDWHLTYISERVSTMLGFEPREFIGHPQFWERHVHPDDLRPTMAEIPRLWKEGQLTFEYRVLHKDGTYRWIREEAKVVRDADGKPVEVMGYWTDITEGKRMEAELVKSQRLATIGQTTAMVGHDLRNPLQAIDASLYVLRKELKNASEYQQNQAEQSAALQMLDMIEGSVDYMNKIVSDLQSYAAPLRLELAAFSIDKLLSETLSTIRIPPSVKVSVNVEEGFQSLTVDPALMKRVFTNLAMNAVQAMSHGGELMITARENGENALISFSDTGAGIAKEDLARLFEPFFTTKARGQGLGLSVCKRLVEAHGGNIIVDSTISKGSTFTVSLPLSKSETS